MTGIRPKKSRPLHTPGRRPFGDHRSHSSSTAWANNRNSGPGASTSKRGDTVTQDRAAALQRSSRRQTRDIDFTGYQPKSGREETSESAPGQPSTQHVNRLKLMINQLSTGDLKSGKAGWEAVPGPRVMKENLVRREGCGSPGMRLARGGGKNSRNPTAAGLPGATCQVPGCEEKSKSWGPPAGGR